MLWEFVRKNILHKFSLSFLTFNLSNSQALISRSTCGRSPPWDEIIVVHCILSLDVFFLLIFRKTSVHILLPFFHLLNITWNQIFSIFLHIDTIKHDFLVGDLISKLLFSLNRSIIVISAHFDPCSFLPFCGWIRWIS